VVLTHQHIDHLGLASVVAARSGAQVAAIDAAVPFIERYSEEAAADDEFALRLMLRHGVPKDVATALQKSRFNLTGARSR
jgi:glyoxylase-like metal-dependent hydrolase (beta-lactamase superfamily II)